MSYDLNFENDLSKTSLSLSYERFTFGRLSYITANVKLWESPQQSRGVTHD